MCTTHSCAVGRMGQEGDREGTWRHPVAWNVCRAGGRGVRSPRREGTAGTLRSRQLLAARNRARAWQGGRTDRLGLLSELRAPEAELIKQDDTSLVLGRHSDA